MHNICYNLSRLIIRDHSESRIKFVNLFVNKSAATAPGPKILNLD